MKAVEYQAKYDKLTPEQKEQFKDLASKMDKAGMMHKDHPLRYVWMTRST